MSKYFGNLGSTSEVALTLIDLTTETLQAMEQINKAELMPWINQAVMADAMNLPITDLNDIQGAVAKISQNVKNRIETERPQGYRSSNRGTIFTAIDDQVRTALNNKAQELLQKPSVTLHQDMASQNKIIGNALLEGRMGVLDALHTVDKNFENYKKVFPENLHEDLLEELHTEIAFFALAANADPVSKAQILEDAAPYLSPTSLLKAQSAVEKSFNTPSREDVGALTRAFNKVIEGRELTPIENRFLQARQVHSIVEEIKNQDLSGLGTIISDKSESILSFLTQNYVNATSSESGKKDRRNFIEEAMLGNNLSDALKILVQSPRLKGDIRSYLDRQLVEVSTLEGRRAFLEKEYLSDSAQVDARYGFQQVPTIDFTNINSMTDNLSLLQENFDRNRMRNAATTFFDEVNFSSFLQTMDATEPQKRYELLSGVQQVIDNHANAALIRQLAAVNPSYAVLAETNSLLKDNFSASVKQSFETPTKNEQDDLAQWARIAYANNPALGNAMFEFYQGLPEQSAARNSINSQLNTNYGGFIEPVVLVKDAESNVAKIPVVDTLRKFSVNDLGNLTGAKLFIKNKPLTVGEVGFLTLSNEGGGIYGLYFGNNVYPENRVLDGDGSHVKIEDRFLRQSLIEVNRRAKEADLDSIFDRFMDGVF